MKHCFYVTTIAFLAIALIVTVAVLFSVEWPDWDHEWTSRDTIDFYEWAESTNSDWSDRLGEIFDELDANPDYQNEFVTAEPKTTYHLWTINPDGEVTLKITLEGEPDIWYPVDFDDPQNAKFLNFRDAFSAKLESEFGYGQHLAEHAEIYKYNADYAEAQESTNALAKVFTQAVGGSSLCLTGVAGAITFRKQKDKSAKCNWFVGVLLVLMILCGYAAIQSESIYVYAISKMIIVGCLFILWACDPECKAPKWSSCKSCEQTVEDPSRVPSDDLDCDQDDTANAKPCFPPQDSFTVVLDSVGGTDVTMPSPGSVDNAQTASSITRRLLAAETS